MAAWFSVYCPRSMDAVSSESLAKALIAADFATLAEEFGIEDEHAPGIAKAALRVEESSDDPLIPFAVTVAKGRGRWPLLVHRWTETARVREEIAEAEESLAGRKGCISQVRTPLAKCVEVWAIELGLVHLEGMPLVIAGQIAEHLATLGRGLIRDPNDDWWSMPRGVPKLVLGRER